jgi:hypothetical protein
MSVCNNDAKFTRRSVPFHAITKIIFLAFTLLTPSQTWANCGADGCYGGGASPDAGNCQWRATCNGDVYGSETAPMPNLSAGTRLDNGRSNILHNSWPNLCRFVDNAPSGTSLFVPQGSAADFGGFCTICTSKCYVRLLYPANFIFLQR